MAQLAICGVVLLAISCSLRAARAIVVPGLDRLPGTSLEGMPDELWFQHTAEIVQKFEGEGGSVSFQEFCRQYAGIPPVAQTEAMIQWSLMGDQEAQRVNGGISPRDSGYNFHDAEPNDEADTAEEGDAVEDGRSGDKT